MHRMMGVPSPYTINKQTNTRTRLLEIFKKKQEPKTYNEKKKSLTKDTEKNKNKTLSI